MPSQIRLNSGVMNSVTLSNMHTPQTLAYAYVTKIRELLTSFLDEESKATKEELPRLQSKNDIRLSRLLRNYDKKLDVDTSIEDEELMEKLQA